MPPLKLDDPITWATVLDAIKTLGIVGGAIWFAATFTAETKESARSDSGKIVSMKSEIAELRRESTKSENRLAVVETNIVFIREALSRIERALNPRAP